MVPRAFPGIAAGDLARVGAADAVGHDIEAAVKQAVVGRQGFVDGDEVFVVTSHQAGIGAPGGR